MAILNIRKNKVAVTATSDKAKKLAVVDASKKPAILSASLRAFDSNVIVRPRVTEKATALSEKQGREVAVFEVSRQANKRSVALAIEGLYKVTPEKIAIMKIHPKRKFVRGHMTKGTTGYKAYVYLKKGDKLEII